MIIGDINQCGRCPHDVDCEAINEFWGFCHRCMQMVKLAKPKTITLKDPLTRELPRLRQDPLPTPPFNTLKKKDC